MKKLLIGGTLLLASVAAIAQVGPAPSSTQTPKAARVHTRADVQTKVAEHFAKVDANHDGVITKAEADSASQAFRAKFADRMKERRDDRHDNAFERLDSNRDGSVSRAEWDSGVAQREQRMASRGKNGDGLRDWRGGRGMHGGMGGLNGHMFETADANKDGRVTLQEAQAAALKHFDMADINRDGQITPDERKQVHERMRAEHRG